jgi:hypothetical protein
MRQEPPPLPAPLVASGDRFRVLEYLTGVDDADAGCLRHDTAMISLHRLAGEPQ